MSHVPESSTPPCSALCRRPELIVLEGAREEATEALHAASDVFIGAGVRRLLEVASGLPCGRLTPGNSLVTRGRVDIAA